ncbi:MAG TPA: Gfo/Idh/MocA family oxidoreductase [Tepidisphaeraceae bacterium]|nr:Gfo/Idh/MocA family oxidoreductase [Tepidisphaeraceae bacterium]
MIGKRIGFVDYKLDNFHANIFLKSYRNQLKHRGAIVAGCHPLDEDEGRAWARKNDVPYFDDPTELNGAVDCYMVLAPSNPDKHLELCQRVFQFGKPTYVDKTFAPDLATAQTLFQLADKHNVPVQTTSALRYTNVQAHAKGREVRHMTAWGGGSSFGEYAIHPVEMVVSVMGPGAVSLLRRGDGKYSQLLIDFDGDRTATINVYAAEGTPFAAAVTDEKGTKLIEVETSKLFVDTAAATLDFFEAGKPNIDRAESLTIRRILDAAATPEAREGFLPLA